MVSDPSRPVLDGALNQKPVLTRGTVALGALATLAAAAAVVVGVKTTSAPKTEPVVSESLAAPQDVKVVPVSADTVEVQWSRIARQPESIRLFQIKPGTTDDAVPVTVAEIPVPGAVMAWPVKDLPADTKVCFELVVVRGGSQSPRSKEACGTTAKEPPPDSTASPSPSESASGSPSGSASGSPSGSASGSPSGSASGSPSESPSGSPSATPSESTEPSGGGAELPSFDEQWVLALPFNPDVPGSDAILNDWRQRLEANEALGDAVVGVLKNADYPNATWGFLEDWQTLYVGPYPSQEDAEAKCAAFDIAPSMCAAYQPGDPS